MRDPAVHWNADRVLFSMVSGGEDRSLAESTRRQACLPEETASIEPIAGQPVEYNNVSPVYTTDDRILFTSDRPPNGATHLYPQLDEYDAVPTVSGIWLLDPGSEEPRLLNHTPSGAFDLSIDSFGRVIFTQWDHLMRDQLADQDAGPVSDCYGQKYYEEYGTFNWSDESAEAVRLEDRTEVFPEPRACRNDLLAGTPFTGSRMHHFFPWQMRQDGRGIETLNHVGRHELFDYVPEARDDDPNVVEHYVAGRPVFNKMLADQRRPQGSGTLPGNGDTGLRHAQQRSDSKPHGSAGHQHRRDDPDVPHPPGYRDGPRRIRRPTTAASTAIRLRTTDGTYVVAHTANTRGGRERRVGPSTRNRGSTNRLKTAGTARRGVLRGGEER